MCPELFHIGPVPIRSFGIMLALSFLAGVIYVSRMTRRDGKDFEPYLTVAYILIIGGILGARISYVLLHWSDFAHNLGAAFNPFHSGQFGIAGLNLYGGVLAAIGGAWVYCHLKKMSVLEVFDYFSPSLALGIGISRIGCYLNGCCFGTPTELPWGVMFPVGSIPFAIFGSQHIHPAQIYSSLYGFGLFVLLHFMMKKKQFIGQLVSVLFISEACFRYAIEYVRYYEDAMYFDLWGMHPTYNQVVSISLFIAGAAMYYLNSKKARSAKSQAVDSE